MPGGAAPTGAGLDGAALARSVVHAGAREAWSPVFERLDAGLPLVLGVFGASVAQNGGCLDQPYKRCMRYDGVHRTFMRWGEPRIRPFKGFAVRLLEHLNRTWPHARHQINNSALDATPAQNALPCLFSHLPTTLHVVILEFGSMAFHLHARAVEAAARMLLALNPPPLLVFLSMHEWCQRLKDRPRALYVPGERLRGGYVYPDTPWARAEAETERVCRRYGQACVSVHRALEPLVRSRAAGFSLGDVVGDDCLHPTHGTRGVEYVTRVLTHAFDEAAAAHRARPAPRPRRPTPLPAPLHESNARVGEKPARCYGFVRAADYRNPFGQSSMYRALQPINWRTAWCAASGAWVGDGGGASATPAADVEESDPLASGRGRRRGSRGAMVTVGSAAGEPCSSPARPAVCPRAAFGTSARAGALLRRFLALPPRTWFWCYHSLALSPQHQKKSPGVLALSPGATLHATLDTRMSRPADAASAGKLTGVNATSSSDALVTASIEHLVSYEGMGAAAVRCVGGCSCDEQRIDAHRVDAHRNVSVYLQHTFTLRGASAECGLQLQVLQRTSSGAHKFKVRTITLSAAS